jgi:hypothetical protein
MSWSSEQMINQFPYEACIIRKDLLPQTLRHFKSVADAETDLARPSDIGSGDSSRPTWCPCDHGITGSRLVPYWFPPAYDLASEVQHFITDYREVCNSHCWNANLKAVSTRMSPVSVWRPFQQPYSFMNFPSQKDSNLVSFHPQSLNQVSLLLILLIQVSPFLS